MDNKEGELLTFKNFKPLYEALMKGVKAKVLEQYEKFQTPHPQQLTVLDDTLLHIAVYMCHEDIARELLNRWPKSELHSLCHKNDSGDTILHEVAAANMVGLAKDLLSKAPQLLSITNNLGETPLFRVADNGRLEMFKFLEKTVKSKDEDNLQRHLTRKDKTNILHMSILAEYFDLAFEIAKKYPGLLVGKDGAGKIGLQLLSNNPSAFMSGRNYGWLKRFIFKHCIPPSEDKNKEGDGKDYNEVDSALTKINKRIWKFLSGRWPMKKIYEDYRKHESALRLAKFLVKKDTTWVTNLSDEDDGKISLGVAYRPEGEGDGKVDEDEEAAARLVRLAKSLIKEHEDKISLGAPYYPEYEGAAAKLVRLAKVIIKNSTPGEIQNDQTTEAQGQAQKSEGFPEPPTSLLRATSTGISTPGEIQNDQTTEAQGQAQKSEGLPDPPTSLLTATSTGIVEIVNEILTVYPQAVEHVSNAGQNILHIAIKHRQLEIFRLVKKMKLPHSRLVRRIDKNGYTLLHHVGLMQYYTGGTLPGPVLQLQDEWRWYERVKKILPPHYEMHRSNNLQETAPEFFRSRHSNLLKAAQDWLKRTSESCSTVAVLIATVAFAAAYTVPGGSNPDTGVPILLHDPFFLVFTVMDVLSLASSLTSVVMFLSILTSPFELEDFRQSLPRKLTLGLTFLFISVAVTMLAFAATIVLIIHLKKRWITTMVYSLAFLPVAVLALLQFPLYLAFMDTMKDSWKLIRICNPWCAHALD